MFTIIKGSTRLKELDVSFNDIGDNGISVITEWLLSNKTLTKLNVSRCKLSVKGTVLLYDTKILHGIKFYRFTVGDTTVKLKSVNF